MSTRRSLLSLLAGLLVMATTLAVAAPAEAARIKSARVKYRAAIEPFAGYQAQTTCSPRAKPGVTDFSRRILRAFPTTRSLGIVRGCSVGGRSEHKEGRAWDWGVSAYKAKDRKRVARVMHWLLKTDKHGNQAARARRLGIQYMIWNRKIWGSYAADRGWRKYRGASAHKDHVHFSFTWAGARGRTSFWTGKPGRVGAAPRPTLPRQPEPPRTPAPTPAPTYSPKPTTSPKPTSTPRPTPPPGRPEPRPQDVLLQGAPLDDETVYVDATVGSAVTTGALQAGQEYVIEVSGTYGYGPGELDVADAECSTSTADATWRRDRSVHPSKSWADHLDLYWDGHDLYATEDVDTGGDCDLRTHTYRDTVTATRTGRLSLELWDPTELADNRGGLTVRVISLAPKPSMTWDVPAAAGAGATSPGGFEAGVTYLLTVSGTVDAGGGVTADAECSASTADPVWRDERSVLPDNPTADHLDLLLDRRGMTFRPTADPDRDGCDDAHVYRASVKLGSTRAINLRVDDPAWADNTGALRVTAVRVDPVVDTEPVLLDTAGADVVTARNYLAGQPLTITATGTYAIADGITADAECSATTDDPTWRSSRSSLYAERTYLGDVTVDGRLPGWSTASGYRCDPDTHTYTWRYTPSYTGPLSFGVADLDRTDNSGTIALTVSPAES